MRYAIFGALILSLELLGVSVAGAIPANGNAIVKAGSSDVIQFLRVAVRNINPIRKRGSASRSERQVIMVRL